MRARGGRVAEAVRKRKPGGIGKSLAHDSYFVKRVVEFLAAGNQFSRGAAGGRSLSRGAVVLAMNACCLAASPALA